MRRVRVHNSARDAASQQPAEQRPGDEIDSGHVVVGMIAVWTFVPLPEEPVEPEKPNAAQHGPDGSVDENILDRLKSIHRFTP